MKYSIYNTILKLNNKYICVYNAFSDKYTIVKHTDEKLFEKISPEQLKQDYPSIYRSFIRTSIITKNNTNQTQTILKNYQLIVNNDTKYALKINPTLDCNFKCWYCYEEHIKSSEMSEGTLQAVLNHINSVIRNNQGSLKDFTISFFGGEPLLKYNKVVVPILDHYTKVCRENHITPYISFTSNGYILTDKMINSIKSFNVDSFQITLDGDRERHDKTRFIKKTQRGSYDRILGNVKKLLDNKINVVLRINFTEEKIPFIKNIALDIPQLSDDAKSYLTVDFQRVWQDGSSDISREINEVIDCFKNKGFLTSYFIEQLSGYQRPCYADYRNEVLINYNGDVFKCTARDFKSENRNGVLSPTGEVIWDENYLEKRMDIGLTKDICKKCRIFPLCGGGCGQKLLETKGQDICLMEYDEERMNDIVYKRFNRRFIENQ